MTYKYKNSINLSFLIRISKKQYFSIVVAENLAFNFKYFQIF